MAATPPVRPGDHLVIGLAPATTQPLRPKDLASTQPIEGVVPRLPTRQALPDVRGVMKEPEDKPLRDTLHLLFGRWRQSAGPNAPDFTEGGYSDSEFVFQRDGVVLVQRSFGAGQTVRLTRRVDYVLKEPTKLVLGSRYKPEAGSLIAKEITVPQGQGRPPVVIRPATLKLPSEFDVQVSKGRLVIGDKTYVRIGDD